LKRLGTGAVTAPEQELFLMKKQILTAVAIVGLASLGACNQQDTAQGQNVANTTDAIADNMDVMADNMSNDMMEDTAGNQAEMVRDNGAAKADAIDDAADNGASNAQLNAMMKN